MIFDVRPEERRATWLAFTALLGITAAHTTLETARDALFLTKVPATHLPLLYLAIAGVGLVTTRIGATLEARRRRKASANELPLNLAGAAVLSAVFWLGSSSPPAWFFYVLYVYSGIFGAWIAGRLWIRLGAIFTVGQAKRLYGLVGTGGVLGAVFGAALARAALAAIEVRHLILAAALLLVATAVFPARLLPSPNPAPKRARDGEEEESSSLGARIRETATHPYLSRILVLAAVAAAAGTAIDFAFKREVATMPAAEIAPFLATVSLGTNIASLVAQSVGVAFAMRILGVHRALYVMPFLVTLSAGGALLGLGLAAAVSMRAVDGSLRHSLHKTSTELLFVPLPDAIRGRAKPIVDLVGQRGGQALASVALLGLAALSGTHVELAVGLTVVVLGLAWLRLAHTIRPRYLDVFRETLRGGRAELAHDLPELDMSALEALIAALSSKKDPEVLGALDILAAQKRGRLVPSLVLFHPSKPIVLRALELLVREGRTDFVPVADRLLEHADPEVRAAALRARAAVEPDETFLRECLGSAHDEIRATALVLLVAAGNLAGDERMVAAVFEDRVEVRRAFARALSEIGIDTKGESRRLLGKTARTLARDDDGATRAYAAHALAKLGAGDAVPVLLGLLGDRAASSAAIDAIAALGDMALDAVERALDDPDTAPEVKLRLVPALARSTAPDALPRLVKRLVETDDTAVRARILRALLTMKDAAPVSRKDLLRLAEQTIAQVARALAFRIAHAALLAGRTVTPGAELIQKLLTDKEVEGKDRLFLVLALLHPEERFARIMRGLDSAEPKTRAGSRELLENVVAPELRASVLALFDDTSDEQRLAKIGRPRTETSYSEIVTAMVEQGGELAAFAAFHANEAGIRESVNEAIRRLDTRDKALAEEMEATA